MRLNLTSGLFSSRMLARSSQAIGRALERLSSGRRINAAKDDAAGLGVSERMLSEIRSLSVNQRSLNDTQAVLNTVDSVLQTQLELSQRMREIAVQASSGTISNADRANLNEELQSLLAELDRLGQNTEFNGLNLLDGSLASLEVQTGTQKDQSIEFEWNASQAGDVFTRHQATGVFTTWATQTAQNSSDRVFADVNNDGAMDIISTQNADSRVLVELSNGDGTFSVSQTLNDDATAFELEILDLNGDGNQDIFLYDSTERKILTYLGNGTGQFTAEQVSYETSVIPQFLNNIVAVKGDWDGDGDEEIGFVTDNINTISIYQYQTNEDGRLSFSQSLSLGVAVPDLVSAKTGDIDGDGRSDLAVEFDDGTAVYHNQGASFVNTGGGYGVGGDGGSVTDYHFADLNGDGRDELVTSVFNFYFSGPPSLSYETQINTFGADGVLAGTSGLWFSEDDGGQFSSFDLADFDSDGDVDIISKNGYYAENDGSGAGFASSLDIYSNGIQFANDPYLFDFDGDEVLDALEYTSSTQRKIYQGQFTIVSATDRVDVSSQENAQRLIGLLDSGIVSILENLSSVGSVHNRLESAFRSSERLIENLSEARSRLVDADYAYETAELVRSQIMQQAALASLAQANLQMQTVLVLLQGR